MHVWAGGHYGTTCQVRRCGALVYFTPPSCCYYTYFVQPRCIIGGVKVIFTTSNAQKDDQFRMSKTPKIIA